MGGAAMARRMPRGWRRRRRWCRLLEDLRLVVLVIILVEVGSFGGLGGLRSLCGIVVRPFLRRRLAAGRLRLASGRPSSSLSSPETSALTSLELCAAFSRFNGFGGFGAMGGGGGLGRRRGGLLGVEETISAADQPELRLPGGRRGTSRGRKRLFRLSRRPQGQRLRTQLLQVGAAGSGAGSVSGGTGSSAAAAGEGSGCSPGGVLLLRSMPQP